MEETIENSCFISMHRNQVNPVLHPRSTLTFAYGDRKYDKLGRQLAGQDNILRTKVLKEINEDFHQGDKLNIALDTQEPSVLVELIQCFKEQDEVIRELASRAVIKVASIEKGRFIIVEDEFIPNIRALFDDPVVQIRSNAYQAMINLAEFTYGVDSCITFNIIQVLVEKLVEEKSEEILVLILELLKILNEGEHAAGVVQTTRALQYLNSHLISKNERIREMAAMNLGSISFNILGKESTIDAKSIPPLCVMLSDPVSEVRTASTRALASLAQFKEGKVQIYDLDKLNEVIKLLYDHDEQTRVNTIQIICNMAEYPPAKEKLKECITKLQDMVVNDQNPLISKYGQQAIEYIQWQP